MFSMIENAMGTAHTNNYILAGLIYVLNEKGLLSKIDFDTAICIAKNSAEGASSPKTTHEVQQFGKDIGSLLK